MGPHMRQWEEEGVEMMLERTCPDHQEARERSYHVGGGLSEEAEQGQKDNHPPTHTPSCGDHGLGCGVMAGARYRFNNDIPACVQTRTKWGGGVERGDSAGRESRSEDGL